MGPIFYFAPLSNASTRRAAPKAQFFRTHQEAAPGDRCAKFMRRGSRPTRQSSEVRFFAQAETPRFGRRTVTRCLTRAKHERN